MVLITAKRIPHNIIRIFKTKIRQITKKFKTTNKKF